MFAWWNLIAGAAEGHQTNQARSAVVDNNNKIAEVNAKSSNAVRAASNEAAAARGNLARWVQSLNNQRRLKAGGEQLEAIQINYARGRDVTMLRDVSRTLRDAEQSGAQYAAIGASGLGGTVTDMVVGATNLRQAIAARQAGKLAKAVGYDAARRAGNVLQNTIGGLDASVILDSLDYKVDVAHREYKLSGWTAMLIGAQRGAGVNGDLGGPTKPEDKPEPQPSYSSTDAGKNFSWSDNRNPYALWDSQQAHGYTTGSSENFTGTGGNYDTSASTYPVSSGDVQVSNYSSY